MNSYDFLNYTTIKCRFTANLIVHSTMTYVSVHILPYLFKEHERTVRIAPQTTGRLQIVCYKNKKVSYFNLQQI